MDSHIILIEVIELLVVLSVRFVGTEARAAIVAKPYIITSLSQDESWCSFSIIPHPLHHVTVLTVLKEYYWLGDGRLIICFLTWDSVEIEHIVIGGANRIAFRDEAVLSTQLRHGFPSVTSVSAEA